MKALGSGTVRPFIIVYKKAYPTTLSQFHEISMFKNDIGISHHLNIYCILYNLSSYTKTCFLLINFEEFKLKLKSHKLKRKERFI